MAAAGADETRFKSNRTISPAVEAIDDWQLSIEEERVKVFTRARPLDLSITRRESMTQLVQSSTASSSHEANNTFNNSISSSRLDQTYDSYEQSCTRRRSVAEILASTIEHQSCDGSSMLSVPILGYETMEHRSKFTVFKLLVKRSDYDHWFIFRRYTDFSRLYEQLQKDYPGVKLRLPAKRIFGNYNPQFLDERMSKLQQFVNDIIQKPDLRENLHVRKFLCLDEPPGPHDSLEESRALCETLEEAVYSLRRQLHEKNREIDLLRDELAMYKRQTLRQSTAITRLEMGAASRNVRSSPTEVNKGRADIHSDPEVDQDTRSADGGRSDRSSSSIDVIESEPEDD